MEFGLGAFKWGFGAKKTYESTIPVFYFDSKNCARLKRKASTLSYRNAITRRDEN